MKITKTQIILVIVICLLAITNVVFYLAKKNNSEEQSVKETTKEEFLSSANDNLASEMEEKMQETETKLVAAGDIILSRTVGVKIRAAGDNSLPFRNVFEVFNSADLAVTTLDAPFNNTGPLMTEGMVFKVEPEFIEGLLLSGFDVVSLAGNHFGDQGYAGMEFTLDWLEQNNIKTCGAGMDIANAHQPALLQHEGVKFAFLAYNEVPPADYGAAEDWPGTAWMEIAPMTTDVQKVRESADVVVVMMHAGIEYDTNPTANQQEFARAAIDAGADLVIGGHPHIVQSVEEYNDGFIIYSLGNFVFDQMWSQETMEGVIAELNLKGNKLQTVDFYPVIIEDYSTPRYATPAEAEVILSRMQLSDSHIEINE